MSLKSALPALLIAVQTGCVSTPVEPPAPAPAPAPAPVVKVYPVEEPPAPQAEIILSPDPAQEPVPRVLLGSTFGGEEVYLSDMGGKVVLVSYWASWCPPCWAEMPELEAIHQGYRERGVEVVAVNHREDDPVIHSFLRRQPRPLTFTVLRDPSGDAGRAQGIRGVPATVLYDARGAESRRYTGVLGFSPMRLRSDIEQLLRQGG